MYRQNYNPLAIGLRSIIVAAVPIDAAVLRCAASAPRRKWPRHLGISAPWAAFAGVVASFVVALLDAYRYPYSFGQTIEAWVPWMILIACVVVWGLALIQAYVFPGVIPIPQ